MGVQPDRVLMIAFAISGAIAGRRRRSCGSPRSGRSRRASDLDPTIKAFIALVLGGLGSTRGALMLGGFALGAVEVAHERDAPRAAALGYQPAIVFAAVIAILILRPRGLSGTKLEPAR